jgi:hypothetical protein
VDMLTGCGSAFEMVSKVGCSMPLEMVGGPKWMGVGFGFGQRFGWSLCLDGDIG